MSNESQLRIIKNISAVKEHNFFSESVQSIIDELEGINTLKDLIDKATNDYYRNIKTVFDRDMREDVLKYNEFLKRVEHLENTFSSDIDYI